MYGTHTLLGHSKVNQLPLHKQSKNTKRDVVNTKEEEIGKFHATDDMITTTSLNLIMMNDMTATASFIFDYSLLF